MITGPESSGKSFLTENLAKYYDATRVQEFARQFLENKPNYTEDDLLEIAKGQLSAERKAFASDSHMVFCDTGIEVIYIWSEVKFGRVNPDLINLIEFIRYDLVLLCSPNIPWEFDELREHPNEREQLFEKYQDFLESRQIPFAIINEVLAKRLTQCVSFIDALKEV